jgi:putative transposase
MNDKYLSIKEIAELLSRTRGPVLRRAKLENWPYRSYPVKGGKERRYRIADLPEDVQAAYAESVKDSFSGLLDGLKDSFIPPKKVVIDGYSGRGAKVKEVKSYDALPEKYRQIAEGRRRVIKAYEESGLGKERFVEAYNAGEIAQASRAYLGPHGDSLSKTTFYNWLTLYERKGLEGIAPQYSKRGVGVSLSQEAKDRIEWLYLDSSRPSVAVVCDLLPQYGIEANESTVRRYINNLPPSIISKYRYGRDAHKAKFETYIVRDYAKYKPMEIICGDYMTQDFVCRKGDRVFRAHLCAFMDMRTRLIVGWSLQESASGIGVIRSLQMAFNNYGLPKSIYVDNGKEFKNFMLCGDKWKARRTNIDPELLDLDAGILAECGVEVSFSQPYNGQAKTIERLWRTVHERFDKFEIGYTGSNTSDKPDDIKGIMTNVNYLKKFDIESITIFEEVERRLGNWFNWYNEKRPHSGNGMNDRPPMEVYKELAEPRREIPENIKRYLFTMRYVMSVDKNGVKLDGVFYHNEKFLEYTGRKVEVRRPIDDAGTVHIFSYPDRVFLFDAQRLEFTGVAEEDIHARAKARKDMRNLEKKYNKKKAEFDKGVFKTPAEAYAHERGADDQADERLVVNGAPIAMPEPVKTIRICKETGLPMKSILDRWER